MDKTITVKVEVHYGDKKFIYPVCETSKKFLALTKNKSCLTQLDIDIIRSLGYEINIQQDKIEL